MSMRLLTLALLALGCAAEPQVCGSDGAASCLADPLSGAEAPVNSEDTVSFIQKSVRLHDHGSADSKLGEPRPRSSGDAPASTRKGASSLLGGGAVANETQTPPRPECIGIYAAISTYNVPGPRMLLQQAGYTMRNSWTAASVQGDLDYMEWWGTADGHCIMAIKGGEPSGNGDHNAFNGQPRDVWGLTGVHSGLVSELEPLVSQVNFAEIRTHCSGSLMVAGHSMGGGQGQLLAMALNNPADALGAQVTVDSLYLFGPMAVSATRQENPAASDRCFAGGLYVNSVTTSQGIVQLDTVRSAVVGGHINLPVRIRKVVLSGPGSEMTYPCGTPMPGSFEAFPILLPNGQLNPAWDHVHSPLTYATQMGCL